MQLGLGFIYDSNLSIVVNVYLSMYYVSVYAINRGHVQGVF